MILSPAQAAASSVSMTPLLVIGAYLALLLGLGALSSRFFRGTSSDFFVASRSIGPFLLLMSVFGTTMTAFALVGSTAKAFDLGIGVYGMLASWSGLVHTAVFFFVGIRLWAIGKRHGYVTQIQYFRDRFRSPLLGYLMFPMLVGLVIPYLLIGLLGAGSVMGGVTAGMFPDAFASTNGAIPPWLTGLIISAVVLFYVFFGGVRSAAWANTFQTLVFMITGVVAFYMIARAMGGVEAATKLAVENAPKHLAREGMISHSDFFAYGLIPLSVGMFPHVFQHWLTARSAKTFRLTVVAHPIFIMIVWVPCILIGVWAAGMQLSVPNSNAVLGKMVGELVQSPFLTGLLTAGILAAIMSSLDSQFVCLGTMFTNDIVVRAAGRDRFTDRQKMWMGRGFVVAVVAVTYLLSLFPPRHIFDLGVWCFSGFTGLFPLVFAAIYWKRTSRQAAIGSVLITFMLWSVFFYQDIIARTPDMRAAEGPFTVFGMMPVVTITLASIATIVIVSLLTQPLPDSVVDRFFPSKNQSPSIKPTHSLGGEPA